jgi:D-alanine-D-alanine ligase
MRIGLTYNLKPDATVGDRYEEFDSLETVEALEGALRSRGHHPIRLGWGMEMLDGIAAAHVEGVFNLAEGVGGRGRESQVPAVLEMMGIPCTGSDALAIGVTLDKALGKLMARAHGIATAPWMVVSGGQAILPAWTGRFPLFVKPAAEGSSMGITAHSICRHQAELEQAVARVGAYGPVLVEEFLPGDEYTVGIVAGEIVGVMQVMPRSNEEDFIYSLEVKRDYQRLVEYRLVEAPDVAAVAMAVWKAFELRDVARVDVRRDRDGIANFVEVNPLPGVHPVNSDLVILAKAAGWTYDQLISGIMSSAEARWNA